MFGLQPKGFLTVVGVLLTTSAFLVVLYSITQQQTLQVPAQTFDQQSCEAEGGTVLPEGSACEGEAIPIIINSSTAPGGDKNPEGSPADPSLGNEPTQQPGQIKAICCMRVAVIPTAEPTIIVPTEIAKPTDLLVLATPTSVIPDITATSTPLPSSSIVPTDAPGEPSSTPAPSTTPSVVPSNSPQITDNPGGGGGGDTTNSCEIPSFTVTTEVIGCVMCSNL